MEIRQLYIFRAVAHTLHFTQAAEMLNYAQSHVSTQIRILEDEFGTPLFNRLGKQVSLTDAGQRMLQYTEQILQTIDEMRVAVPSMNIGGKIVIGASETLCTYRLPPLLSRFREEFPQAQIVLKPIIYQSLSELQRSMSNNALDVAFVLETEIRASNFIVEDLMPEPLIICAHPQHSLQRATCLTAVDLRDETLLMSAVGCRYRELFERALASEGIKPKFILELQSVEAMKKCVMEGMGIALLPQIAVATELATSHIVRLPWSGPGFQIHTHMIRHKEKWESPIVSTFLALTRDMFSKHIL